MLALTGLAPMIFRVFWSYWVPKFRQSECCHVQIMDWRGRACWSSKTRHEFAKIPQHLLLSPTGVTAVHRDPWNEEKRSSSLEIRQMHRNGRSIATTISTAHYSLVPPTQTTMIWTWQTSSSNVSTNGCRNIEFCDLQRCRPKAQLRSTLHE